MLKVNGWQVYRWQDGDRTTLIDTGAPGGADELTFPGLTQIVLTHWHTDHVGAAPELRTRTGARVSAGAADAAVLRGLTPPQEPVLEDWERPLLERASAGLPRTLPPMEIDEDLAEGQRLDIGAGAEVLSVPGHTDGSIAVHLPTERILFTGDAVAHSEGRVILGVFNTDRKRAIESFHRLADLDVDTVCFGHGDPIVGGAGKRLREAAEAYS